MSPDVKCAKEVKYKMVERADMGVVDGDLSETFLLKNHSGTPASSVATRIEFEKKERKKEFTEATMSPETVKDRKEVAKIPALSAAGSWLLVAYLTKSTIV